MREREGTEGLGVRRRGRSS